MLNRLHDYFHSGRFTGHVIASSDQFALIRFQNFPGFVSLATDCEGDHPMVLTVCVPSCELLGAAVIRKLQRSVLEFFDCNDAPCLIVTTEPASITPFEQQMLSAAKLDDTLNSTSLGETRVSYAQLPEAEVFSFPRRFDLAAMMSISSGYAILFAVMRLFGAPPELMFATGGLIAAVGVSQAVLFQGRSPRAASLIVGGLYCAIGVGIAVATTAPQPGEVAGASIGGLIWGAPLGYFCGTLVGGIFLVAEYIRRAISAIHE